MPPSGAYSQTERSVSAAWWSWGMRLRPQRVRARAHSATDCPQNPSERCLIRRTPLDSSQSRFCGVSVTAASLRVGMAVRHALVSGTARARSRVTAFGYGNTSATGRRSSGSSRTNSIGPWLRQHAWAWSAASGQWASKSGWTTMADDIRQACHDAGPGRFPSFAEKPSQLQRSVEPPTLAAYRIPDLVAVAWARETFNYGVADALCVVRTAARCHPTSKPEFWGPSPFVRPSSQTTHRASATSACDSFLVGEPPPL